MLTLQKKLRNTIDRLNIGIKDGHLTQEDLYESYRTGGIDYHQLFELLSSLDVDQSFFEAATLDPSVTADELIDAYNRGDLDEDQFNELMEGIAEDDEPDISGLSKHECPCCQECLALTEEAFLLEVMEATQVDGEVLVSPILAADDNYQYEPLLLHFNCWEECLAIIKDGVEFQQPYEAVDGILVCSSCASTLAPFEPYVATTFGEIRYSSRTPEGEGTQRFERLQQAKPVCIACMVYVIEDHLESWEDLLEQVPIEEEDEE